MNKPDRTPPEPSPLAPSASAGQILSSARDEWDLSVEEVAQYLNLSTDTIKALEQDAYEQLPGSTFIKGYIRSYAKLLKLDQEEIIACVNLEPDQMSEIPATRVSLKRKGQTPARPRKSGNLFFRILLIVGVLAGLGWFALKQLPNLDKDRISEILKLPTSTSQAKKSNEISFPMNSDDQLDGNKSADGKKSALIRIE
jgi:cytoskeleton protein RodZ